MSQYGAMGAASQGWDYRTILAHYYTGTALATLERRPRGARAAAVAGRQRRVLRRERRRRPHPVAHPHLLRARPAPAGSWRCSRRADACWPRSRRRCASPAPRRSCCAGTAANGRSNGAYRGALEFRPGALGGVNAINAVGLDDYVQGVVPAESPSSWPIEALKAQAVAARTYAVTTSKAGDGFDQYPDTRSQVYGGVAVETPSTNAATQATRGQLVTYDGTPVITFFFSTSGGRTENVENSVFATQPQAVAAAPSTIRTTTCRRSTAGGRSACAYATAGARLGGLVKGRFKGIAGRPARRVAADRQRRHRRLARAHARHRRDAARALRPLRHVGLLHLDPLRPGAGPPHPRRRPRAARRGGVGPAGAALVAAPRRRRRLARLRAPGAHGRPAHGAAARGRRLDRGSARANRRAAAATASRLAAPGVYRVRWAGHTGPAVRVS